MLDSMVEDRRNFLHISILFSLLVTVYESRLWFFLANFAVSCRRSDGALVQDTGICYTTTLHILDVGVKSKENNL